MPLAVLLVNLLLITFVALAPLENSVLVTFIQPILAVLAKSSVQTRRHAFGMEQLLALLERGHQ
jgi:hypothetical protein